MLGFLVAVVVMALLSQVAVLIGISVDLEAIRLLLDELVSRDDLDEE